MAPWLAVLEAYLVQALLRTPGFHRGVEKVARRVHRIRHGLPPEDMGGTKIDRPDGSPGFSQHFLDEIRTQLGRAERQQPGSTVLKEEQQAAPRKTHARMEEPKTAPVDDESAEGAWRDAQRRGAEAPPQGFMGEYMEALRNQLRGEKPPK